MCDKLTWGYPLMKGLRRLLAITGLAIVSLGVADGLYTNPDKHRVLIADTKATDLIVPGLTAMGVAITGKKRKDGDSE
jgi:hypothetical protein